MGQTTIIKIDVYWNTINQNHHQIISMLRDATASHLLFLMLAHKSVFKIIIIWLLWSRATDSCIFLVNTVRAH
jgi:hypothetical protein